jgi:hypothetical protein
LIPRAAGQILVASQTFNTGFTTSSPAWKWAALAYIFGAGVTKRLRGKLHSVLEKLDHGHPVLRIYFAGFERNP